MRILSKTLIVLALLAIPANALAIGQMTKPIVIEGVLRGTELTEELILSSSEDEQVVYQLSAAGDIDGWVTFYTVDDIDFENPVTDITIEPNSNANAIAKFNLPDDLPNGTYEGEIVVSFKPESKDPEEGSSSVTLSQRIGRPVLITVTDQEIVNFHTSVIPESYDISKNQSLKIRTIYDNNGNTYIRPDVQLKIKKDDKTVFNAIFPYPEDEDPASPKARKDLTYIEWSANGQSNGTYRAELTIMLNGEVIEEKDFKFTIGYSSSNFLAGIAFIGFGNLALGWTIIGVALLVIAAVLVVLNKRRGTLL